MGVNSNKFVYFWILVLVVPNIVWICLNKSVWPWDQAWYGEITFTLWRAKNISLEHWLDSMLEAFKIKAPLIAWMGQFFVPLSEIFGYPEAFLLLYINIINVITVILVCGAGNSFTGKKYLNPTLVASIAIFGSPLFMAMSHEYFVEPLQGMAVAYSLWLWAKMREGMCRAKSASHLLLLISIALASKSTTPIYIVVAGTAIIYEFTKLGRESCRFRYLFLVPIPLLILVVAWYYKNFYPILEFAKASSSGSVALNYGANSGFLIKVEYWLKAISQSLSIPLVFYTVILLAAYKMAFDKGMKFINNLLILLIIQCLIILIALSLNINQETRYLFPLIPIFGLIVYLLIYNNKHISLIFLFIFTIQYGYVAGVALQMFKPNYELINYWLKPYVSADKEYKQLVKAALLSCKEGEDHLVMVGVEYPEVSANSMAFIAAQNKLACRYTSLGYAAKDFEEANLRFNELKPSSFITVDASCQKPDADFLNILSKSFSNQFSATHKNCKLENKTVEGCFNEYRCEW